MPTICNITHSIRRTCLPRSDACSTRCAVPTIVFSVVFKNRPNRPITETRSVGLARTRAALRRVQPEHGPNTVRNGPTRSERPVFRARECLRVCARSANRSLDRVTASQHAPVRPPPQVGGGYDMPNTPGRNTPAAPLAAPLAYPWPHVPLSDAVAHRLTPVWLRGVQLLPRPGRDVTWPDVPGRRRQVSAHETALH